MARTALIPFWLRASSNINAMATLTPSVATKEPLESTSTRKRPVPITELLLFPITQEEYREVMEEITLLYQKRQYRQCSARCVQILENITDPYRVHPLYLIYLSFYAASSMEITARALHVSSSNKLPLFQKAIEYYQNAESHMDYATYSANPTFSKAVRQRSSSISSSVCSSVDSVFSRPSSIRSANSSAIPSPTNSVYGGPELELDSTHKRNISTSSFKSGSPRIKKKVSFSDSPTLVGDDEGRLSARDSLLLDAFPSPPTSPIPLQTPLLASSPSIIRTANQDRPASPVPEPGTIDTYLLSRSINRYLTHLSSLHTQLHYHIGSVSAQIRTLNLMRKARRSNLPNLFEVGGLGIDGIDADEIKRVDLRARIERLKEAGWRRERFNPERYQNLCDNALEEL
ncbi:hypothetical protein B0O99DRAFT_679540 [Bisporella sp. PMI_857]|nr:hypothetical protein B0O99DRAFT_679540 [Bisporella sp. PMI_857]